MTESLIPLGLVMQAIKLQHARLVDQHKPLKVVTAGAEGGGAGG